MIKSSALKNIRDDSMIPALGGFCRDWAITMTSEHQRTAFGGHSEISRRWFLDATVDIVFFKAFCAALEKVGVTPMGLGGPAVFHFVNKTSAPAETTAWVEFRLEALDLRIIPDRHQLDQLNEGYFLTEGEA
jgi:hypothetical protein